MLTNKKDWFITLAIRVNIREFAGITVCGGASDEELAVEYM